MVPIKRTVEALRDREHELTRLVDMVPAQLWQLTPKGDPVFFNKSMVNFLGREVMDLHKPGASPLEALIESVHPDDAGKFRDALAQCLVTGEGFALQYRLLRADGVYRWMSGHAEPLRDDSGVIVQWYGASIDIDDLMAAQEALRVRERELSLVVDMVPSHLWRVNPEGETNLANKHMADFLGRDLGDKEALQTLFDTIFHPDDVDGVSEVFNRCLATGEHFSMKYRLRRADGVYRWMSGRAEPMRDASGRIVQWFGLCHDIDDQVHAEEALRRASDKLARATQAASLAELSASIAHEVNQPLAAIVANSEACHRWLSAESPNIERAKMTAERIRLDADAAADVVSRIRTLFRRAPHSRSSEDLNRLINEVCRLVADELAAKHTRIKTNLEPDLPSVAVDRVQVQQVFVNLIRNGIEAMDSVVDDERALHVRTCRDGIDAIRVEVCDAGTGFRDAERAFDPFFTTKRNGMGMGLAICRSIIESHGGRLWTANNETRGATVAFTLQIATEVA
jgi:PAS domain S-box-containing protein